MALATVHMAAMPIIAGLVAGTVTTASYVVESSPPTRPAISAGAVVPSERPCSTQTWPYVSQNCLGAAAEGRRKIRVVAAPSGIEPVGYANVAAEPEPSAALARGTGLVTGDAVLRQPQNLSATGAEAPIKPSSVAKPRVKRTSPGSQGERRYLAQSYQVPVEMRSAETRPVIVVRPMSVEYIRPCDDRRC
jgi:hypothetical protein